jgi:hypothetical protein
MSSDLQRFPQLTDPASQLEPYFVQKDLLRDLIRQIRKDFESAGVPIKLLLSQKYSYDDLCTTMQNAFRDRSSQQLFNLLYRVDVSEKQLLEGMPTPGIDDRLFAEIIVKRELQKVVLRKLYSRNSSSENENENRD